MYLNLCDFQKFLGLPKHNFHAGLQAFRPSDLKNTIFQRTALVTAPANIQENITSTTKNLSNRSHPLSISQKSHHPVKIDKMLTENEYN